MSLDPTSLHSLRRVFNDGFSAHDIAEPLISFDATAAAATVRSTMAEDARRVAGVREKGVVVSFMERPASDDGVCADYAEPFADTDVIPDSSSLAQVVMAMKDKTHLFVAVLGRVGGIITRSDLQKPPVRMWLFGMVTLIEMRFSRLIELALPDDGWRQFLSAGRIEKAESLLAERARRNQHVNLLDCLQFSDKGQIVARNERLRGMTQFDSRRQVEEAFKRVERLRNNLAHSQDIITTDWEVIVQLSENLDRILEGPKLSEA